MGSLTRGPNGATYARSSPLLCVIRLHALAGVCFWAAAALAQPAHLGVRLGYASTTFTADDVFLTTVCCADQNEFERRGGAEAAVSLAFPLSDRIRVWPEIAWVYRGARQTILYTIDSEYDLHYFDVTALVEFAAVEVGPVAVVLEGGPSIAVLLDERAETTYFGGPYGDQHVVRNNLHGTRASYLGATVGAAFRFSGHLSVGGRYSRGLTPFVDPPPLEPGGEAKHLAASFGVGYVF